MTIAALPPAPDPSDDRATFNAKAFALNQALADFVDDANATATAVDADAAAAAASEAAALASKNAAQASESASASNASAAATSAGAAVWSAGSYNAGQSAKSPTSLRVYTARTTGSKPTDPASDPTNWKIASTGGLPDVPYTGTTASVFLGERSRFTNAAAVAATVPAPTIAGEEWAGLWENGRFDNSFDIGAATLRHNGIARTGVIVNTQRLPIHLVSVGANEWRFAA